jgi:hypothetical protein
MDIRSNRMKILVSIPDYLDEKFEEHRAKDYKDLSINKMLVRIAMEKFEEKEKEEIQK